MNQKEALNEIIKIKNIYNKIISNYIELNNNLNLTNIIEIYLLYTILVHKGYLSKKHKFTIGTKKTESDLIKCNLIKGADVINGLGVCRHLSAMLKDIYDKMNINNEIIPVYFYNVGEEIKTYPLGNHVINLVSENNKTFYLDPMNTCKWDKVGKNILVTYDNNALDISSIANWIDIIDYNNMNVVALQNIKRLLSLNSIMSKKEYESIKKNLIYIYENNLDFFEKFYNENSEYYNDISSKLKEIKIKLKKK